MAQLPEKPGLPCVVTWMNRRIYAKYAKEPTSEMTASITGDLHGQASHDLVFISLAQ